MTVSEHLRQHLLTSLGLVPRVSLPPLEVLQETEWCPEFEMHMRNRLVMGAFRYGRFDNDDKWRFSLIGGLQEKLMAYQQTGNTEYLVDLANYALLEFVRPAHPKAHWHGDDDHDHCSLLGESLF